MEKIKHAEHCVQNKHLSIDVRSVMSRYNKLKPIPLPCIASPPPFYWPLKEVDPKVWSGTEWVKKKHQDPLFKKINQVSKERVRVHQKKQW